MSGKKKSPVPGKPGTATIVQTAIAVKSSRPANSTTCSPTATCDYFDGAVVDRLNGTDMDTLFAPTDAAFETLIPALIGLDLLPPGTPVEPASLCKLDSGVLFNVLAYHVTDGRRFSTACSTGATSR